MTQIEGILKSLKHLAKKLPKNEQTVVKSMLLEVDFIPSEKEKLEWLNQIALSLK